MSDEELNRILSGEPELEPSAGFAASVMKAVRREAATPPPIPFPWWCALPGLAGVALTIFTLIAVAFSSSGRPPAPGLAFRFDLTGLFSKLVVLFEWARAVGAGWITLSLLLTVACVGWSLRLMGRPTLHR
jgi:hypothetical protein